MGGERSTSAWDPVLKVMTIECSGNAEFNNVKRYWPADGWKTWGSARDCDTIGKSSSDFDTAFEFQPYGNGIGGGMIRPNWHMFLKP